MTDRPAPPARSHASALPPLRAALGGGHSRVVAPQEGAYEFARRKLHDFGYCPVLLQQTGQYWSDPSAAFTWIYDAGRQNRRAETEWNGMEWNGIDRTGASRAEPWAHSCGPLGSEAAAARSLAGHAQRLRCCGPQ